MSSDSEEDKQSEVYKLGGSRRTLDVVKKWDVKPSGNTVIDHVPEYVIKVSRKPQNQQGDYEKLKTYLYKYANYLRLPEAQYYVILKYEKAQGSSLIQSYEIKKIDNTLYDWMYKSCLNHSLLVQLSLDSQKGKLKKFRIDWLV